MNREYTFVYVCVWVRAEKKKNYGGRGKYLDWCMYSVTQTWGEGGGGAAIIEILYI